MILKRIMKIVCLSCQKFMKIKIINKMILVLNCQDKVYSVPNKTSKKTNFIIVKLKTNFNEYQVN